MIEQYTPIIAEQGFDCFAAITQGIQALLFQHTSNNITVSLIGIDENAIIKAAISYYITAVGKDGETYARDLGLLHDWLYSHFPEVHIETSVFRNATSGLVAKRLSEKGPQPIPGLQLGGIDELKNARESKAAEFKEEIEISRYLKSGKDKFLKGFLTRDLSQLKREITELDEYINKLEQDTSYSGRMFREYMQKGRVVYMVFTICSNAQLITGTDQCKSALKSVLNEVADYDRYQVKQKLNYGKLQINVEQVDVPAFALYTLLSGGPLNPRQLERIAKEQS